jgi:hypothetical protein
MILQNYTTVQIFRFRQSIAMGAGPTAAGPHGRGGQPPWPMAVGIYSTCATAAGPTVVAHGGKDYAARDLRRQISSPL